MEKIRFDDCIWKSRIVDHLSIKDDVLSEIEKTSDNNLIEKDSYYDNSISKLDWNESTNFERPWVKIFLPSFSFTLKEMFLSMGYTGCELIDLWYQQYLLGDNHGWHIHHQHFTGVYYLEFPKGAAKTEICSPYSLKAKKIDVSEGDIIVFPSHWIHRGLSNNKERKTIISYNFSVNTDKVNTNLVQTSVNPIPFFRGL